MNNGKTERCRLWLLRGRQVQSCRTIYSGVAARQINMSDHDDYLHPANKDNTHGNSY
jgi:hypothetical protein